ncbi:DUF58 domain-containing protein [Paenibacillus herberti]|uniref:DUF58 domain-containing protein n=1 Tax=Paenibacillus herberti TaxID=1619309 RepID=A0A229NWH3_9BACL|nr:DUF58 domain-containing protein [Paenibacillus herberti]OXM13989.1 hypothetical protein CGZ75_13365 [Paenibacillus herberti]
MKAGDAAGLPRTRRTALVLLAALFGAALFAVLLRGTALDWFLAGLPAAVLAMACLPKLWAAAGGLSVERVLEPGGKEGELSVRLIFHGRWMPPLLLVQVREQLENLAAAERKPLVLTRWLLPWLSKEWTAHYRVSGLGRGVYQFAPATVVVTDPLGLACGMLKLAAPGSFTVLPQPEETGVFRALSMSEKKASEPGGFAGEGGGKSAGRGGAGPLNRIYREGDSLRRIDWRLAAKGRGLHTRLDEHGASPVMLVLLDLDQRSYRETGADGQLDACAGLAARALMDAGANGCTVRLQAGAEAEVKVAPGDSRAARTAALLLARAVPAPGAGAAESLERLLLGKQLTVGSRIVILTAGWDIKLWEQLADLSRAARCGLELHVPIRSTLPLQARQEREQWAKKSGVSLAWFSLDASRRQGWKGRLSIREEDGHGWQAWS